MKLLAPFLLASLMLPAFSQTANQATLTLVDDDGANEVDIKIKISLGNIDLESEDTAELSGTLDVKVNIVLVLRSSSFRTA